MIDWSSGYSTSWRAYLVNPETWADSIEVQGFESARIERQANGALVESGALVFDSQPDERLSEAYYRIAMIARQGQQVERVNVVTLLCSSDGGTIDKGRSQSSVTGRSVLYPASTALLTSGSYAPAGCDGAQFAAELIGQFVKAPIEVECSFTLDEHVVFDIGSSALDAAWLVLDAGGCCLQIHGDGSVHVVERGGEPSLLLDDAGARLLQPAIEFTTDLSGVPNRYIAIDGDAVAIAANYDESSAASITSRGFRVDVVDESPKLVNGESLQGYAERRLAEESIVREERTYTREWWPDVHPYSIVRGSLPSVLLEGDMEIESQSIECGRGALVTERAVRAVREWR